MYFKKLELVGFKSFCEKTTLHFEPGITAVVGPNGCGKCLRYDSLVTLSNGAQVEIGELVESSLKSASAVETLDDGLISYENPRGIQVITLNPESHKLEHRPISAFIKRKAPDFLLEVTAKSGKKVITTHYHPFFTIKDGQIVSLKAEDLRKGVYIAVPRCLPAATESSNLDLFSVLKQVVLDDHLYVPHSQELEDFLSCLQPEQLFAQEKTAVKSALSGQAINVANFINILSAAGIKEIPAFVTHLKSRSSSHIRIPRELGKEAARFLGYLIAEGRITSSNQVWFVNEEKPVVGDFVACAQKAFGVEAKVFNYKPRAHDVIIFSSALGVFLEKAFGIKREGVSKDKSVPGQLFSAPKEIIGEFLSALFEGDAYVRTDEAIYFEYATASERLARGVAGLLLRLGVQSVVREKRKYASNTKSKKVRTYYSVYVYGLQNVKRLSVFLHFRGRRAGKLAKIREADSASNPNFDLIPGVNAIFKDLVKRSGISVKRLKKISPRLVSYYENRCLPSRQGMREALSIVAEQGNISGLPSSIYKYLLSLADSDVYWDEVVSVKKVPSDEWVYDLSVSRTHNFIAQDMVVHNSNILDSIRWVLGEQSAKSLRGSEMLDVIFNGTDNREPVSLAEVSLTFDNEAKFFKVEAPEVTITRRLFRSGESEYMLNKGTVRLKDILDILLGTGIGAESYSIIAQGKIDLVLSSRPEERRLVFDEASGITKYKAQKREAQRKLEETEQNLLRVNDIVTEVKRQIGSLERQANKARKYKEVFDELTAKEVVQATFQKFELLRRKDAIIAQLKELEAGELALLDEIRALEARIANRQQELKEHEGAIMSLRNEIFGVENMSVRSREHIDFNRKRLEELKDSKSYLEGQLEGLTAKLTQDELKLKDVRLEFLGLRKQIEDKGIFLAEKEKLINSIAACIKASLENIAFKKKGILDIAARIANAKNAVNDACARQQIFLARKKRLEIEKAKVFEEKKMSESTLCGITAEVESLRKLVEEFKDKLRSFKAEEESEGIKLANINSEILRLEKEVLTLQSHKEFLEKLKSKYEDIGEAMNATIYLDKLPADKLTGLVVKIKDRISLSDEDQAYLEPANFKLSGEAKPIELDTEGISKKINKLNETISGLRENRMAHESRIEVIAKEAESGSRQLHNHEIELASKEGLLKTAVEQFNKVKEEEDLIVFELLDVDKELVTLENNLAGLNQNLSELNKEQRLNEDGIAAEEENISHNSKLREEVLVAITQARAECEGLNKQLVSEEGTLKMWEDTSSRDQIELKNTETQLRDNLSKTNSFDEEIRLHEKNLGEFALSLEKNKAALKDAEEKYQAVSEGSSDMMKLDAARKGIDATKNKLYELQIQNKDIDYKFSSIKERMLQAYKVDLEAAAALQDGVDQASLAGEIDELKKKIDSYGTVNLVAIEEYDELKKRYDFLVQQHTDLSGAKDALHQAILKINRTTKQMFIETFEKVKVEFRNYFRLLFNGGDAQLFLIDETDPLESGIEIICRPPGKKLQNVLLLSGGEKSMSAIALIFAIFKVKPSPFCILDEIDAALDEANVDRFSRILQEFAQTSQFIVITHNKKTIANADVMYGITMQESGISRIVSVKFAQGGKDKDKEPEAVAGPV